MFTTRVADNDLARCNWWWMRFEISLINRLNRVQSTTGRPLVN